MVGFDVQQDVEIVHIVRSGDNYSFYQGDTFLETITDNGVFKPDLLCNGFQDSNSAKFEGNMFDVRIYSKALSQSEITAITDDLS